MERIYTYRLPNAPVAVANGEEDVTSPPVATEYDAATLDLHAIVAIKTPAQEGVILVQTTRPKGMVLPYNAAAVAALITAWKRYAERGA